MSLKYREGKIKKAGDMDLHLVRTNDILKALGEKKKDGQILIGFAAEAADLEENAIGKLERKNLDAIVANDISRKDVGFGTEQNQITMFFRDGSRKAFDKAQKSDVADIILDEAVKLMK